MKKITALLVGMLFLAFSTTGTFASSKVVSAYPSQPVKAKKQVQVEDPDTFIFATTCGIIVVIHSTQPISDVEKLIYIEGFELALCVLAD
jgi:hypothetical protein